MSRRIANLLNEPEHIVTKLINELEAKNGYPSNDARHLAENTQKIRLKMFDLGLDPSDTTPQELYHALNAKFEHDSALFADYYGLNNASIQQMCTSAVKLAAQYIEQPQHWALKSAAAKQALKTNAPRKLMKYLAYRSVDSMLKRESIYELYLALPEIETKAYQKALLKYISTLGPACFEIRPVKLIAMDESKYEQVDPNYYASYDSLLGTAGIWPNNDLKDASLLCLTLMLIESFTPKIQLRPGPQAVKMNMVMWWVDTDHLVAELGDERVSLNLKDCAMNHWLGNSFENRLTDQGQKNFWQQMVSRYKNLPQIEPLFEENIKEKLADLKPNIAEPAFEFAEEFDG